MAKKITEILPAGTAVFPKLSTVDVYQPVDKKGRPSGAEKRRYITRVKFTDEDHRKVDAMLKKHAAALGVSDGKLPWKKDKKDGSVTLVATSGEKYRPPVFDAKNREVPASVVIGGGSKIRLDVTVNAYEGFGGGINLYINAVQLLELKQSDFGKSRFGETEGYAADEQAEDNGSRFRPDDDNSSADEDMDDDIPF
jgi:hypothetical protein